MTIETLEDVTFAALAEMRKDIENILPESRRDRLLNNLSIAEENLASSVDYSVLPERLKLGEQISFVENEYENNQHNPEADVLYDILQTLRKTV